MQQMQTIQSTNQNSSKYMWPASSAGKKRSNTKPNQLLHYFQHNCKLLYKALLSKLIDSKINTTHLSLLSFYFVGLVDKILSAHFWIPLSRLTYCAYLVHPIAILTFVQSFETVHAYSDVHIVSNTSILSLSSY